MRILIFIIIFLSCNTHNDTEQPPKTWAAPPSIAITSIKGVAPIVVTKIDDNIRVISVDALMVQNKLKSDSIRDLALQIIEIKKQVVVLSAKVSSATTLSVQQVNDLIRSSLDTSKRSITFGYGFKVGGTARDIQML